jgi:hypothetical protein
MSRYIHFRKLKHLIFSNGGSNCYDQPCPFIVLRLFDYEEEMEGVVLDVRGLNSEGRQREARQRLRKVSVTLFAYKRQNVKTLIGS